MNETERTTKKIIQIFPPVIQTVQKDKVTDYFAFS